MNSFGLMEGLRPFKRYFSNIPIPSMREDEDTMVSDWGIESNEYRSFSTPTLINAESTTIDEDSIGGITPRLISNHSEEYFKHSYSIGASLKRVLSLATDRFERLRLEEQAFNDELKYLLITSQLLDETILISKYYNNKRTSELQLNRHRHLIVNQYFRFWRLNIAYALDSDSDYSRLILTTFWFVTYLAKNYYKFTSVQLKAMLIIIGLSLVRVSDIKKFKFKIIQNSIMTKVKKLIKNFQKLDVLLTRLINKYKELTLYPLLLRENNSTFENQRQSADIYDTVSSTLIILTKSLVLHQSSILNYVNSVELENYCGIYNIELSQLNFILLKNTPCIHPDNDAESLLHRFKNYQYLRRFFICCLLSMTNQSIGVSQFLAKVMRIYGAQQSQDSFDFLSRWQIFIDDLIKIINLLDSLIAFSNNFIHIQHISIPKNTSSISSQITVEPNDILNKLKELQLHLSTLNKDQSIDAQISEFSKIAPLFEQLQHSYSKELTNLTKAQRSSTLNSLHVDKRKRFSLPAHNSRGSPSQRSISLMSPKVSPTNYKRLSTGLALPLLTVMEDESVSKRYVSYDDNYLNITPNGLASPAYIPEKSNNFEERDYISEKNLLSNDDSVIITGNDGEEEPCEDEPMDSELFKRKLESNFSKLLESSTQIEREMTAEINHNNQQEANDGTLPLMNELKAVLSSK